MNLTWIVPASTASTEVTVKSVTTKVTVAVYSFSSIVNLISVAFLDSKALSNFTECLVSSYNDTSTVLASNATSYLTVKSTTE